jgi:DNA-binding Lrp family transcriptional regulator
MNSKPMDSMDQQLLALLRLDARTSTAALAKKLGVARGTISNRLARLEAAKVIVGYTVRLRPDARPDEIKAWMSIAVEGDRTREVVKTLLGEPAITCLHDTNGRWDLLAQVHAASIAALSEVLRAYTQDQGVSRQRRPAFICRRSSRRSDMLFLAGIDRLD